MSAVLRVTGEDLRYLATQLNALADDVHSFPFINVGGMPSCGSGRVAEAAAAANEHFALRALLIETELRTLSEISSGVDSTLDDSDSSIAANAGSHGNLVR